MAKYKPCPNCSATESKKVSFTWWGGIVGPSLLTHVKCEDCGTCYNGKTGQSNFTAIVIYSIVVPAIIIGLIVGAGFLILLK